MKPPRLGWALALALCCLVGVGGPAAREADGVASALAWPPVTQTSRPWARWWWFGSAVNERELTRSLERFCEAGFGGVEISPIYPVEGPVQGSESRSVSYLSPRWIELLRHTLREARRLGLGVDMIQGTGWPFGGPWLRPQDAASRIVIAAIALGPDGRPAAPVPDRQVLQALVAYAPDGHAVDLTERVDAAGRLDWTAPAAGWTLYAAWMRPTRQAVKRAAPGGEGPVLDPYSRPALEQYLSAFEPALGSLPRGDRLRCLFNDSFEVYGANWTADLFPEFQQRRGYDLRLHLPALLGKDTPERNARVRSDYRETISDLLLEEFTRPWAEAARRHGIQARNQAHGSPGNLLDLYAAADIPETEMFGPPPGTPPRTSEQDRADLDEIFTSKLASSAAHVAGRPLCSAESMTWLGEHFQTSLADVKSQADRLFLSGVNHLFYHGAPFSPTDAAWPGWLFYASTDFTPANPVWRDLPALNGYVARCQSFLQAGRPDQDVLLYFPIYDLWAEDHGSSDMLQYLRVHNTTDWLDHNLPGLAETSRLLWRRGYDFDFVSDSLLREAVRTDGHALEARGASYRVLVVAGCTRMPPETLERIVTLAREGATVLVVGEMPRDVPGLADLDARRQRLHEILATLHFRPQPGLGCTEARIGQGRVMVGPDLEAMLAAANVPRERLRDLGLEFVRRSEGMRRIIFLCNRSQRPVEGWVPLAGGSARGAVIFDPLRRRSGRAAVRNGDEVYLQLQPGESCVVRTTQRQPSGEAWPYLLPAGELIPIQGSWSVTFVEGGPSLPAPLSVPELRSWTEWPGEAERLRAFSGTARYRIRFPRPAETADAWMLDLGEIHSSARVRLNGRDLGTLICPPFRLELPGGLLQGENELEVEVTSLMANRIADLDRRKVPWRKFYFVDLKYRPFNASGWQPLPSGLLGPVRLLPVRRDKKAARVIPAAGRGPRPLPRETPRPGPPAPAPPEAAGEPTPG